MVVEELVADEDRAVLPEPEHEVAVARLGGVEPHQVGGDAFELQRRLHGASDLVAPDMGSECGREAEARETDRGVGRVSAGVDRHGVLEGDLAPEGEVHPVPVIVLPNADVGVGQPDEHIGGRVSHAEHVEVRHVDMCTRDQGGPTGHLVMMRPTWGPIAAPVLRRLVVRPVAGLLEQAAQIRQLLGVDVLVAPRVEGLGLSAHRDQQVSLVGLLDGTHGIEQREDRMPFDVVAEGMPEDLRQRVAMMAVQVLGRCHVGSSRLVVLQQPDGAILALRRVCVRRARPGSAEGPNCHGELEPITGREGRTFGPITSPYREWRLGADVGQA